MVICPDCGKEVPKTKFCRNCGAYIENIDEPIQVEDTSTVPIDVIEEAPEEEIFVQNPPEVKGKIRFCANCGYELGGDFNFCPNCGHDLKPKDFSRNRSLSVNEDKNILLAVILSVFLPGLGQIYLGLDHKGVLFLIAYVISAILMLLIIGFLLVTVIWIWALVDTIQSTNALNRGEEVKDKLF